MFPTSWNVNRGAAGTSRVPVIQPLMSIPRDGYDNSQKQYISAKNTGMLPQQDIQSTGCFSRDKYISPYDMEDDGSQYVSPYDQNPEADSLAGGDAADIDGHRDLIKTLQQLTKVGHHALAAAMTEQPLIEDAYQSPYMAASAGNFQERESKQVTNNEKTLKTRPQHMLDFANPQREQNFFNPDLDTDQKQPKLSEQSFPKKQKLQDLSDFGFPPRQNQFAHPDLSVPKKGNDFDATNFGFPQRQNQFSHPDLSIPKKGNEVDATNFGFPQRQNQLAHPDLRIQKRGNELDATDFGFPQRQNQFAKSDISISKKGNEFDATNLGFPQRQNQFSYPDLSILTKGNEFDATDLGFLERQNQFAKSDLNIPKKGSNSSASNSGNHQPQEVSLARPQDQCMNKQGLLPVYRDTKGSLNHKELPFEDHRSQDRNRGAQQDHASNKDLQFAASNRQDQQGFSAGPQNKFMNQQDFSLVHEDKRVRLQYEQLKFENEIGQDRDIQAQQDHVLSEVIERIEKEENFLKQKQKELANRHKLITYDEAEKALKQGKLKRMDENVELLKTSGNMLPLSLMQRPDNNSLMADQPGKSSMPSILGAPAEYRDQRQESKSVELSSEDQFGKSTMQSFSSTDRNYRDQKRERNHQKYSDNQTGSRAVKSPLSSDEDYRMQRKGRQNSKSKKEEETSKRARHSSVRSDSDKNGHGKYRRTISSAKPDQTRKKTIPSLLDGDVTHRGKNREDKLPVKKSSRESACYMSEKRRDYRSKSPRDTLRNSRERGRSRSEKSGKNRSKSPLDTRRVIGRREETRQTTQRADLRHNRNQDTSGGRDISKVEYKEKDNYKSTHDKNQRDSSIERKQMMKEDPSGGRKLQRQGYENQAQGTLALLANPRQSSEFSDSARYNNRQQQNDSQAQRNTSLLSVGGENQIIQGNPEYLDKNFQKPPSHSGLKVESFGRRSPIPLMSQYRISQPENANKYNPQDTDMPENRRSHPISRVPETRQDIPNRAMRYESPEREPRSFDPYIVRNEDTFARNESYRDEPPEILPRTKAPLLPKPIFPDESDRAERPVLLPNPVLLPRDDAQRTPLLPTVLVPRDDNSVYGFEGSRGRTREEVNPAAQRTPLLPTVLVPRDDNSVYGSEGSRGRTLLPTPKPYDQQFSPDRTSAPTFDDRRSASLYDMEPSGRSLSPRALLPRPDIQPVYDNRPNDMQLDIEGGHGVGNQYGMQTEVNRDTRPLGFVDQADPYPVNRMDEPVYDTPQGRDSDLRDGPGLMYRDNPSQADQYRDDRVDYGRDEAPYGRDQLPQYRDDVNVRNPVERDINFQDRREPGYGVGMDDMGMDNMGRAGVGDMGRAPASLLPLPEPDMFRERIPLEPMDTRQAPPGFGDTGPGQPPAYRNPPFLEDSDLRQMPRQNMVDQDFRHMGHSQERPSAVPSLMGENFDRRARDFEVSGRARDVLQLPLNHEKAGICGFCQARFGDEFSHSLLVHISEEHVKFLPYNCPICEDILHSYELINLHMHSHDTDVSGGSKRKFERENIKTSKVPKRGEQRDLGEIIIGKGFKCRHCEQWIKNSLVDIDHESKCGRGRMESCAFCHEKYELFRPLKRHILREHVKRLPFTCKICKEVINNIDPINDHLKAHRSGKNKDRKGESSKSSTSKDHSSKQKPSEKTAAQKTDKGKKEGVSGASKPEIDKDIILYTEKKDQKEFKCQKCEETFTQLSLHKLKGHIANHRDTDLSVVCGFCENFFMCARDLKTHLIKHVDKLPHKCGCGHTSDTMVLANVHEIKFHLNDEEFKVIKMRSKRAGFMVWCDLCEQEFPNNSIKYTQHEKKNCTAATLEGQN